MPNSRSSAGKAKNSHKGNSPSQERSQESGGEASHGNGGEDQKQGRGIKQGRGFKQGRNNGNPFGGVKNITGGRNLKDGCLPKLFMLFLPFMAIGTYFFLKSIAT